MDEPPRVCVLPRRTTAFSLALETGSAATLDTRLRQPTVPYILQIHLGSFAIVAPFCATVPPAHSCQSNRLPPSAFAYSFSKSSPTSMNSRRSFGSIAKMLVDRRRLPIGFHLFLYEGVTGGNALGKFFAYSIAYEVVFVDPEFLFRYDGGDFFV